MAIPLIPALERPMTNAAEKASIQAVMETSDTIDKNKARGLAVKDQKYIKKQYLYPAT